MAMELPFPERQNPFLYVHEESTAPAQNSSGTIADVRVLGFADLGQLRVIL